MRARGRAQALPTPWEMGVTELPPTCPLQITPQGKAFCRVRKNFGSTRRPFDVDSVVTAGVY